MRAATIEEIEAEKSLIEKDVVSFFSVMVDFCLVCGSVWRDSKFQECGEVCICFSDNVVLYSERENGKDY